MGTELKLNSDFGTESRVKADRGFLTSRISLALWGGDCSTSMMFSCICSEGQGSCSRLLVTSWELGSVPNSAEGMQALQIGALGAQVSGGEGSGVGAGQW